MTPMGSAPVRALPPHALGVLAVLIGLAWSAQTRVAGGPALHWLVTPLALHVLGLRWALLAAVGGGVFAVLAEGMTWSALPRAWLLDGFLPILVAALWSRQVERRLPPHLFIYFFVSVFAGTLLATLTSGALERLLHGVLAGRASSGDWWIALLLLADGEALTTGIIVTGLALYRPEWLQTFDPDRYLRPPSG